MKRITKSGNRFWLGSLKRNNNPEDNLTIILRDLTGKVFLYDSKGNLTQETNVGDVFTTKTGLNVQVVDFITSTGLQIKSDPGISTIYFAFLLLMLSTYVSFFTYSQVWFTELNAAILVGGKSNRAVLFFQQDFKKVLKKLKP